MNKFILTLLVLSVMLMTPMAMAALPVMRTPVSGGNYTTLTFNCTKAIGDSPINTTLMWIMYNTTAGNTGASLGSIANDTGDDVYFASAISIESLADATTYNFTCKADNGTTNVSSAGVANVRIDNTAPTKTLTWDKPSVILGSPQEITWTTADATSGISSVTVTVTPENTDLCDATTYTDEDATAKQFLDTDCDGTYTVLLTATDTAGNSATEEETFNVLVPGGAVTSGMGSGLASGIGKTTDTKGKSKTIVLVAIIGIVIFFLIRKK